MRTCLRRHLNTSGWDFQTCLAQRVGIIIHCRFQCRGEPDQEQIDQTHRKYWLGFHSGGCCQRNYNIVNMYPYYYSGSTYLVLDLVLKPYGN